MKQDVNFGMFCDAFQIRKENFSYDGKKALYEYLTDYEEMGNEEIELDVISLCCDYSEYKDITDYLREYFNSHSAREVGEEEKDFEKRIEEEIQDKTTLIKIGESLDEGFIIQAY